MDANFHALILSDRRRRLKGVFEDCTENNHLRAGQPSIDPQRATQRVGSLGRKASDQPTGPSQGRHDRIDPRHDLRTNSTTSSRRKRGTTPQPRGRDMAANVPRACTNPARRRAIHIDDNSKDFDWPIECALRRKRRQRWRRWRWLP